MRSRWVGFVVALGGIPVALVGFAPRSTVIPLMAAVIGVVVAVPAVYSYLLWRAEQRAAQH